MGKHLKYKLRLFYAMFIEIIHNVLRMLLKI